MTEQPKKIKGKSPGRTPKDPEARQKARIGIRPPETKMAQYESFAEELGRPLGAIFREAVALLMRDIGEGEIGKIDDWKGRGTGMLFFILVTDVEKNKIFDFSTKHDCPYTGLFMLAMEYYQRKLLFLREYEKTALPLSPSPS